MPKPYSVGSCGQMINRSLLGIWAQGRGLYGSSLSVAVTRVQRWKRSEVFAERPSAAGASPLEVGVTRLKRADNCVLLSFAALRQASGHVMPSPDGPLPDSCDGMLPCPDAARQRRSAAPSRGGAAVAFFVSACRCPPVARPPRECRNFQRHAGMFKHDQNPP